MKLRRHDAVAAPASAEKPGLLDRRSFLKVSALPSLGSLIIIPGIPGQTTPPSAAGTTPTIRLTILGDNAVARPGVKSVWGFACLVEARGHTVLFDTGADPAVLKENLAVLGVLRPGSRPSSFRTITATTPGARQGSARCRVCGPSLRAVLRGIRRRLRRCNRPASGLCRFRNRYPCLKV